MGVGNGEWYLIKVCFKLDPQKVELVFLGQISGLMLVSYRVYLTEMQNRTAIAQGMTSHIDQLG